MPKSGVGQAATDHPVPVSCPPASHLRQYEQERHGPDKPPPGFCMIAMIPPNRPNLIKGPAVACLALLGSCMTRTTPLPPDFGPRPVTVLGRWSVELGRRRVGSLTLLRVEDPFAPQTLYKVDHAGGQHAGWIDLDGRAWRAEPFRDGLVLAGMDTMAEDLRNLLELVRRPRLVASTRATRAPAAR